MKTPRRKIPEPTAAGKVVVAASIEDVTRLAAEAAGPVVLEFVDEANCHYCAEEIPKVKEIAEGCGGLTVIQADLKHAALDKLADDFGIEGVPTLFYADKGADLKPGTAAELADSDALRKRIKCPRP